VAELAVGSTIAGYRIDSIAGYGGMGVVYAATELELGRRVALKVIHADRAEDESFRERFMRESRIAASIDHPNVIPIYRAAADADRLYIAMRYVDGTDLRSLVTLSGRLPAQRAAGIIVQVAAALDAAHSRGLVHRDVKPANVLIDGGEHAYLTDFGVARTTDAPTMTSTGQFVGTVQYAAPEQFRGDGLDARTDIYSLGAVLFFAVTGEPPFVRDSDAAAMYAQLSEPPRDVRELEPGVSAALADVIARALAKDPDARFQSAGDFGRAALSAAGGAADEATVVPPARASRIHERTTVGGETARRAPKRAVRLAAATLALLAAIVALVLVLAPGNQRPKVTTVPLPGEPGALRAGAGVLWVDDDHAGAVKRIGANGRPAGAPIGVGGKPADLVLADGALWVAIKALRAVVRVDPAQGRVDATIAVPFRPNKLTTGDGRVFVASRPGRIEQIDVARGRMVGRRISTRSGREQIIFADGALWIANEDRDQLARIDVGSGRTARTALSGSPDGLGVGDGALWVVSAAGTLTKFDPRTLTPIGAPVSVGGQPDAVVATGHSVFVASSGTNQVSQVDGRSMRIVRRYAVGDTPVAIAVFDHAIWVSNFNGASLSRIALSGP
jgi:streptogramin lyase